MAKHKPIIEQLDSLAESLKKQNDPIPEQTIIPTHELEALKATAEKNKNEAKATTQRKVTYSLTLSKEVVKSLDDERSKNPFGLSRSEFIEYILKEYLKNKDTVV